MAAFSMKSVIIAGGALLCLTLSDTACGSKTGSDTGAATTTLAPGSVPTTTTAPTTTAALACGRWPRSVLGYPQAIDAADKGGYFIWQDGFGWHVRVRSLTPKPVSYSGTFTGSADMGSVTPYPQGVGAAVKAELKANQLTYDVQGDADLKGFDLLAGCPVDQLSIDLKVAGQPARTDSVYLGSASKGTSSMFTLQKTE